MWVFILEKNDFKREQRFFPKNKFLGHQFCWQDVVTDLLSVYEKNSYPFWLIETTENQGIGILTLYNSGYRELVGPLTLLVNKHNSL